MGSVLLGFPGLVVFASTISVCAARNMVFSQDIAIIMNDRSVIPFMAETGPWHSRIHYVKVLVWLGFYVWIGFSLRPFVWDLALHASPLLAVGLMAWPSNRVLG